MTAFHHNDLAVDHGSVLSFPYQYLHHALHAVYCKGITLLHIMTEE